MHPDVEAIEQRRRALRVSEAQMCRVADVNQSTWHKMKTAATREPRRTTIGRLNRALNAIAEQVIQ